MVILVGIGFEHNCKVQLRVNSSTLKVVTAMDVGMVALTCVAGIVCGLCSVKSTQQLNLRLRKLDESLQFFLNHENDRFASRILATVPATLFGALISYDYFVWMRVVPEHFLEATFNWYLPFYGIYLILIGSHILYASNALGLGRRFRRLNTILKSRFLLEQKSCCKMKIWVTNLTADQELSSFHKFDRLKTQQFKPTVELLTLLVDNYESLYKCVEIFSKYNRISRSFISAFGFAVLCNLISCALHLIITGHFLIIALDDVSITLYTCNQLLWITMHVFRLLLVVEACHKATVESKNTIHIISEINRKNDDQALANEFQKFWQHLSVYDVKFSVLGICNIDRNILTAFTSGIATYLFVVLQFQSTRG
ncbi:gustatory receptor for sugar taste 43a-like [Zeugodacus cucurbitae]|uniref:gustatory receptor for sugar taste 43a-like n=1 Tax=Zeugodacus cucurbitae TaxID=28588 RepID=UPI0023D93935|nr:gustatory receptor for sugar taste 43a-like [Zeugodacus cucurbitae]